ncbi:DUF2125 domain-containing protein [Ferrovibrio sp.]|uniref:DUF2125 domain-containing protein n=1 Tax=Ferrovibrio sp. TaxID=1917215 RepID=UPI0035148756
MARHGAACYICAMRYRFALLAGLIVGGLVAYYFVWAHLADQLQARLLGWIAAQQEQGRMVSYERIRLWGFPYRLSATLTNVQWQDPQSPAAWRLQADSITAHLQLWDPQHVIFDIGGSQQAGWTEAGPGGAILRRQAGLATERFRASLVMDATGTWQRLAADLTAPHLTGTADGWSAAHLLLHARRAGNVPPGTDLAIQAEALQLPAAADGPLGRAVAELKLVGTLRGPAYGGSPEEMLRTWREAGGILELQTILLQWGALRLEGDGSLAVDRQYRPLGAMAGRIYGAGSGIDALAAAGKMTAREAAAAKAAVTLLEQTDAERRRFLPVPLAAQDGQLSLGPVSLFSLPSVLPALPQPAPQTQP